MVADILKSAGSRFPAGHRSGGGPRLSLHVRAVAWFLTSATGGLIPALLGFYYLAQATGPASNRRGNPVDERPYNR